jgi:hypothetical protein
MKKIKQIMTNPTKNKYFEKRGIDNIFSFDDFKKSQENEGDNYIQLENKGLKGIRILEMFIMTYSEKSILDISENEWIPMVRPHKSRVNWKSIGFSNNYTEIDDQKCIISYEDDCIRLEFSNVNDTTIELLFLNVQDKCKGLGSKVLNNILDICDEMGLILKVLPINYEVPKGMYMTDKEYLKWLREWYKSFDLITIDKTPNLYFIPTLINEINNVDVIENSNEILRLIVSKQFSMNIQTKEN